MSVDINRLLLELERALRTVNREVINPEFAALKIDDLEPAIRMVAQARCAYLKGFFELSAADGGPPSPSQIEELSVLRHRYEELLHASQALETAIERGYLDVIGKSQ